MRTSTLALQEQTTLRRYAMALLRRRSRLLYELPSILCLLFGVIGSFVGSYLCSLTGYSFTGSGASDSITKAMVFSLGGAGILGGLGGFLGRRIVDYYLKPCIPVA